MNIETKHYNFRDLTEDGDLHYRRQLRTLYDLASSKPGAIIVELGTQTGRSSTVFLQACHEHDGQLFSIDVDDCSQISQSERFHFVRSDSTDAEAIVQKHPEIKAGIDVLFVDTIHTRRHVEKEIRAWWPYLNAGASIAFDDVDPHYYRPGQKWDKATSEINKEEIAEFVEELFRANLDTIEMQVLNGHSGLAILTKHSPLGDGFNEPQPIRRRGLAARIYRDATLGSKRFLRRRST